MAVWIVVVTQSSHVPYIIKQEAFNARAAVVCTRGEHLLNGLYAGNNRLEALVLLYWFCVNKMMKEVHCILVKNGNCLEISVI